MQSSSLPITIRRPFGWGVVFVIAEESKGDIPIPVRDQMVSANDHGISIMVRHAQDTDEVEGEYLEYAEVEIGLQVLDARPPTPVDRRAVFRGTISLPTGRLSVGDADEEMIVQAHRGQNTIIVSISADSPPDETSPGFLWVDLLPGESPSPPHVSFTRP